MRDHLQYLPPRKHFATPWLGPAPLASVVRSATTKVSEDRQLSEFTLRNNAKFANGDSLNAQALTESYAWFLATRGSGQLRVNGLLSAERIEVIDDVTVRLHLDRPVAWGLIGNAPEQ